MHEQNKKFEKAMKTIKKLQTEILQMKNTITELKNSIEFEKQTWPYRRINDLEDRTLEIIQSEEQKKKELKRVKKLYDT